LWAVVHDICLQAYPSIGVAFPCAEVNIANGLEQGFVVLQTPSSARHVLVVPTARISGIESPALLSENAPNYWKMAWDARRFVEKGAGRRLPRNKIGMAIYSAASRSQDQLHIHVACVAPAVAAFLRRQAEIHGAWSSLRSPLIGHRFSAMKVETDDLAHVDLFKLLARGLPSGKFSMGRQTLAVIGATFRDSKTGFYLLTSVYWAQMVSIGGRFDHVLVDEYQDTNQLQASILLALKPGGCGLTVVGDDAQSI
jgi:CDP-diacylglycerol pyrophosphatase